MTDESVLQSPGDHTVEEVVAALHNASPEEVERVKSIEREADRPRKGITEYVRPAEAEPESVEGEKYDLAGWRERARGWLGVSPHAVSGALHGEEGPWTQAQVEQLVKKWLEPPKQEDKS